MFTALLDTSVLWPSLQRDFLLSLAAEGLYRPIWSWRILAELEYHEAAKLRRRGADPDEAQRRAGWLVAQMDGAFDDAGVEGWEGLEGTYGLPDTDDEHVLAAAVVGGAGAIVTANLKDFPAHLLPAGIQAIPAPDFVFNTVSIDLGRSLRAVEMMAGRSGRHGPALTVQDILDLLVDRYEMGEAVGEIMKLH